MKVHHLVKASAKQIRNGIITTLLAITSTIAVSADYDPLPEYHVDLKQSTVAGVSSGAYFASQFHVAWSQYFEGVGIFAGGPWGCALGSQNRALGTCMEGQNLFGTENIEDVIPQLITRAQTYSSEGKIDDLSNIQDDRIFILSGKKDPTVKQRVSNQVITFYQGLTVPSVPSENIAYVDHLEMGHAIPTDDFGNPCEFDTEPPWISNCNYDGAGEMLKHIYGAENINERTTKDNLSGKFIEFDQSEFTSQVGAYSPQAIGMNDKGVLYVPESCDPEKHPDTVCRLHVFFHGCRMNYDEVPIDRTDDDSSYDRQGVWSVYPTYGDTMWKEIGLNEWADTNNMIVMYPQWAANSPSPFTNQYGCNDWWGYTGANYDQREAPQMKAIQLMIERILGQEFIDYDQKEAIEAAQAAAAQAESEATAAAGALTQAQALLAEAQSTTIVADMETKISLIESLIDSAGGSLAIAEEQKVVAQAQWQIVKDLLPKQEIEDADYLGQVEDLIADIDSAIDSIEASESGIADALGDLNSHISSEIAAAKSEAEAVKAELETIQENTNAAHQTAKNHADAAEAATDSIAAEQAVSDAGSAAFSAQELAAQARNKMDTTMQSIMTKVAGSSGEAELDVIAAEAEALAADAENTAAAAVAEKERAQAAYIALLGDEAAALYESSQTALNEAEAAQLEASQQLAKVEEQLAASADVTTTDQAKDVLETTADLVDGFEQILADANSALADAKAIADEAKGTAVETATANTVASIEASIAAINAKITDAEADMVSIADVAYAMALADAQAAAAKAEEAKQRAIAAKELAISTENPDQSVASAKEIEEIIDEMELYIGMAEASAQNAAAIKGDLPAALNSEAQDSADDIASIIESIEGMKPEISTSLVDAKNSALQTVADEIEDAKEALAQAEADLAQASNAAASNAAQQQYDEATSALAAAEALYQEAENITLPEGYETEAPISAQKSGGGGGSLPLWFVLLGLASLMGIKRRK